MDKQIKILMIDDEADFILPMSYWFKSKGYFVTTLHNGQEGLNAIKESPPDIVFLDLIMPDTDGMAVLKKIREFNSDLPVIIMSAYLEDTRTEKKFSLYGISGVFYKGDDLTKAQALLESILKVDK